MPIKYIPFIPEPVEGQAVLGNFNRVLRYKGADELSMTLQRGMPLYEMEKQETVGENTDGNMVIRGECVSACAYLKEQGVQVDLVYIDPPFASGADYAKKVYIRRNPKVAEAIAQAERELDVDELKAFVKSTMLYDNQASDVYTALHDKASYADELPQTALDYYRDVLLYRIYTNAQKYGTDMNALLSSGMMGSSYDSVDAYLADANDSIKSITQQALLMQAVAEKTGFKCDTATMNADFGRYYGTTDPSQYVSAYGENYIKMNVLQSDVMQNLIDNVKYE